MPRFEYKGTKKGDKVSGEVVADNERDARRKLKVDKIFAKTLKVKTFPKIRQFGPFGGIPKKKYWAFRRN